MGDEQYSQLRTVTTYLLYPFGHYPQRVDVQTGIGFIEDGKIRFQDGHLEDFVALLLAA